MTVLPPTHISPTLHASLGDVAPADHPIPFGRLLAVEWRKSTDTRAARVVLALVLLLTLVAAAIGLFVPDDVEQALPAFVELASIGTLMLLPIVSLLAVTTEWTQRTVLSTFTQEPRRGRVLGAKVVCGLLLSLVASAVVLAVAVGAVAISGALGRDVSWSLPLDRGLGLVAVVALMVLMAMGFGALIHNTAGAIVALLVVPSLASLLALVPGDVQEWFDTNVTTGWVLSGDWSGHGPQIVTSMVVWVALPLALGVRRTLRREVQ